MEEGRKGRRRMIYGNGGFEFEEEQTWVIYQSLILQRTVRHLRAKAAGDL